MGILEFRVRRAAMAMAACEMHDAKRKTPDSMTYRWYQALWVALDTHNGHLI